MHLPDWVTKDLIEKALINYLNTNNVVVLGYTSSAAVEAGDNYTSNIFRTVVTYNVKNINKTNSISLIVKCAPIEKEQMIEFVKQIQLFEKEKEVYKNILPALYDILGKHFTLSARLVYCTQTPHEIIIFEDLTELGFKMHSRKEGLDLEHCLVVVEKIADLHAASIVLYDKKPELFAKFGYGLFSENAMISTWIHKSLETLINACSTWNGFEKYSYKLKAIIDKTATRVAALTECKLDGFNVLNHGDAWINNFLFSYNEKEVLDCKFVDYQMMVFSSPAIDLHYFWATSPKVEVRRDHLNTVLDRYYSKLMYNLSKLGYSLEKIPTKKDFIKEWKSKAFYGLVAAVAILPLVKASRRTDASFDAFLSNEDVGGFRHHSFNNERYRKHMEYLLPFFDSLGALDY